MIGLINYKLIVTNAVIAFAILLIAGCNKYDQGNNKLGESCKRTSDCEEELRCFNFVCAYSNDTDTVVPDRDTDKSDDADSSPENDFGIFMSDEDVESEIDADRVIPDEDTVLIKCEETQCLISGKCINDGTTDNGHICQKCNVLKNRYSWSIKLAGTVCRESAGVCDYEEKCNGIDNNCPGNYFVAAGTECTDDKNKCNGSEYCDGAGNCSIHLNPIECQSGTYCEVTSGECLCMNSSRQVVSCLTESMKFQKQLCDNYGHWQDDGDCYECENGTAQIAVCLTDSAEFQKQVCDKNGFWQNDGACYECEDSAMQIVSCSMDSTKFQKQICDENGFWKNDGNCYCENGAVQTIVCSTDSTMIQKQICDGGENWRDSGSCFSPFILCTGETNCYSNQGRITCPSEGEDFDGQDAQYAQYAITGHCVDKSYTITGTDPEEIVIDLNTDLQWQRKIPAAKYEWDDAIDYCESLIYGGYDDWRLPAVEELRTVVNYGKPVVFIDEFFFPDVPADYFWTSEPNISKTKNYSWRVSFVSGAVISEYYSYDAATMCVRGDPLPQSVFSEIVIDDDTIVTDMLTGLSWTKETSGKTWKDALNHCEALDYAGYTDWRLPNINELDSLVNRKKSLPASDFPGMTTHVFFSSSTSKDKRSVPFINMQDGMIAGISKEDTGAVRCVR
ncbi:MAG TPA: DUF1566 domain-containing protein [bacterium]|nr:DUF1566 domain-containing protein [bacterium]